MKRILCALVLLVCFSVGGCVTTSPNTVSQISTIDAILAGAYDGQTICKELFQSGSNLALDKGGY